MVYNTKQDMIDRFSEEELIQLTDHTNTGAIDDAVLNQAIADAAAEIDGYLGGRYRLPLATTPSILVVYGCDITRYRLYDDAVTDQVQKRYDDALKFLRLVSDGKVQIGQASDGSSPAPAGGVEMETGGRVFGRDQGGFF